MAELLSAVQGTPIPNLLVVAGILFVFLALVGELTDKVKVPKERQRLMGGIGAVLLLCGISLHLLGRSESAGEPPAAVSEPSIAANAPTPAPLSTGEASSATQAPTLSSPATTAAAPSLAPTLPGVETIPLDSLAPSIPWLSLDSQAVPATYFYAFTLSAPPFDSAAVRQAFALALDRQALTSLANSLGDDGRPATTFTPPETLGRDLYGQVGLPFDPERAAQALAQAGYPGGEGFPSITLGYAADPNNAALAGAAASMWRANLGIDVTVEEIDDATFFDRIASDPPEIYALGWVADYNDPDGFLLAAFDSASAEHVGGFSKAGFDRLVRQAASLGADPAARQRAYVEAERILNEQEAAIIPLYHFTQTP